LPDTTAPSWPALAAIWRTGAVQRLADDVHAAGLVGIRALQAFERPWSRRAAGAAAGDDAFFHGSAGGVQRVVNAVLALLHLDLGRAADLDDGDAAGQLGETLLQLLAVIVRGRDFDLLTDRIDAALDRGFTGTVDDGGVVLVDATRAWRCRAC
jgi:hypothetical protein